MEATTTTHQEAVMASSTRYYQVDLPDGTVGKRSTVSRHYTHAVCAVVQGGSWDGKWAAVSFSASEANAIKASRGRYVPSGARVLPCYQVDRKGNRLDAPVQDEAPAAPAPQAAPVQAPNALGTDHLAGQYKAYVAAQLALKAHKANGTTDSAEAAAAQGTMDSLRSGYRAYRKLQAQARAARKGEGAAPAAPQPKPAKAPKPVQYVGGEGEYTVLLDGVPTLQMRKRSESYSGIQGGNGRPLGTYSYWDVWALLPGSYVPGKKYSGMSTGPKLASETTRQRALAAATAKLAQA